MRTDWRANQWFGGSGALWRGDHMRKRTLLTLIALSAATSIGSAQQVPDLTYKPPLPRPAYEAGKGPRVAIDEAHHNFHTAGGRYKPFADLLRRDGYRVAALVSRCLRTH